MNVTSPTAEFPFLILLFLYLPYYSCSLSCLDEDGQPVDWFVLYKLPMINNGHDENETGKSYVYRTSNSNETDWIFSSQSIDNVDSLPGRTLQPLYIQQSTKNISQKDDRLYLFYNDEFPNGTSSETAAHAKGVVAFESHAGFWIVHSVPRYPPSPEDNHNYSFPTTGLRNGQTMLCISLTLQQANFIGIQLQYYDPFLYSWQIGNEMEPFVNELMKVVRKQRIDRAPWFHQEMIQSNDEMDFLSFAKTRQFDEDLYTGLVSPLLNTSLFVETWMNGQGGFMPSQCQTSFRVVNIKEVRLDRFTFSSHKDHSKWAISFNSSQSWICIGDINRMESQKRRGGGCLCFGEKRLWQILYNSISKIERCPLVQHGKKINRSLFSIGQLTSHLLENVCSVCLDLLLLLLQLLLLLLLLLSLLLLVIGLVFISRWITRS